MGRSVIHPVAELVRVCAIGAMDVGVAVIVAVIRPTRERCLFASVIRTYCGRVTDPVDRLEMVRTAVPVDLAGAVLGESWSNDTWVTDRSVLRVCWRGDRERLGREGMLLGSPPPSVPHAPVPAPGRTV